LALRGDEGRDKLR